MSRRRRRHRVPPACPVCRGQLGTTAVTCVECGVEVRGEFEACDFCSLDQAQRDLLRVFLSARGNIKELERHLGVSYPTARARLDDVLRALGIDGGEKPRAVARREVLDAVARGEIDVDAAVDQLG